MVRIVFVLPLLLFSACEESKESSPLPPANHSQQRMEKQKEDLAKFVADFDEAMLEKYGRSTFPPEITGSEVFRIEGTRIFNYNLWVSVHEREQLPVLKNELHRLMTVHGVETVNLSVKPEFEVSRSENRFLLGAWRLQKDGTESRVSGYFGESGRKRDLFDQLRQRNLK